MRALAGSGSIDRPGLLALRDEIDGARRVGLRGQQIARFAGGRVQPGLERIDLGRLLRDVLTEQAMQASASAVGSRQTLGAAEVMGDPSLLEIVPTGHGCEMGGPTGHRVTRVGADGLRQMLASVRVLELARLR